MVVLHSKEIKGGRVLWKDDVVTLNKLNDQLQETISHLGEENELLKACVYLNSTLKEMAEKEEKEKLPLNVYGPFEASVYRVNEKYRMQFVVKCKNTSFTRRFFARLYLACEKKFGGKIQMTMDMNPNNI